MEHRELVKSKDISDKGLKDISDKGLKAMDESVANLKKGKVSAPIDLLDF